MINLEQFIREERPYWKELEQRLTALEESGNPQTLEDIQRFHYLYQRASAALARLVTFASERELRAYLEHLVARAYGITHETRTGAIRLRPIHWFFVTFPTTFRRRIRAFSLSLAATLAGMIFGAIVLATDYESKWEIFPEQFGHLQETPSERVRKEELAAHADDRPEASFSTFLMQNNIRVSITTMALGATWGIGSLIALFYNGVLLGAVGYDFIHAGEWRFLLGWLLPHGSVEIPAIVLAGQAGFVLAGAIIGWGRGVSLRARMREITPDLVTLIGGLSVLLVWAGIIESYISQRHEPVLSYDVKIAFGTVQLILLAAFLGLSGRGAPRDATERAR